MEDIKSVKRIFKILDLYINLKIIASPYIQEHSARTADNFTIYPIKFTQLPDF